MKVLLRLPSGNLAYYWVEQNDKPEDYVRLGVQIAHKNRDIWYEPGDVLKHAWHPVTDPDLLAELASMELQAMTQEVEYLTDEVNNVSLN